MKARLTTCVMILIPQLVQVESNLVHKTLAISVCLVLVESVLKNSPEPRRHRYHCSKSAGGSNIKTTIQGEFLEHFQQNVAVLIKILINKL